MKIYFAVIGLMLNFALVAGPLDESKIKNILDGRMVMAHLSKNIFLILRVRDILNLVGKM